MDLNGIDHATGLGWMIDASHNLKDPLVDLLQSVEAIKIAYAQALLVDRKALKQAQQTNDIVKAQEILQDAFRTDVRPLVAEARLRSGAALNPVRLFNEENLRSKLIEERGINSVATGL
jgi:L-rhamnose isomerase/sugar isomerase